MSTLVIVGSQWGDEGKGKITDYIAQESDVVVRSQGEITQDIQLHSVVKNSH